jgi:hypothetical protein
METHMLRLTQSSRTTKLKTQNSRLNPDWKSDQGMILDSDQSLRWCCVADGIKIASQAHLADLDVRMDVTIRWLPYESIDCGILTAALVLFASSRI